MHFDSIKSRLLLMTVVCVVGMVLMNLNQHQSSQQLTHLSEQQRTLQSIQLGLLQLRRHEKDFLLRKDEQYIELFIAQQAALQPMLNRLDEVVAEYAIPGPQVATITRNAQRYGATFLALQMLYNELGLNQNTGLKGRLQRIAQDLNNDIDTLDKRQAARLAQLNSLVFSYQLSQNPQLVARFTALSTAALAELDDSSASNAVISDYRSVFYRYVDIVQRIGLTQELGLRGEYRRFAHTLEADLQRLSAALQPLLTKQRIRAYWSSSAIALFTSIAMLLLLVKNFAAFHRAFANFVLFFYHCKRQYCRIDPKQLGFSEFRYLAGLANEMVESRREAERRLAKLAAAKSNNV